MMNFVLLTRNQVSSLMELSKNSFVRFIFSGGANTAFTYLVYLSLLCFFDYKVSFTISYISGIAFAYFANRFFVFNSDKGVSSVILLPVVYLIQYVMGLLIVAFWVDVLSLSAKLAPIASTVLLIPVTYVMMRFVFKRTGR